MTNNCKKPTAFCQSKIKQQRGEVSAAGFSLIEVLITMTMFLVVMAAVFQVMKISLIQRNTVSTRIDALKSARIALNYIRRDAINAGLSYHNVGGFTPKGFVNKTVGVSNDTDLDDRDLLTGIISGPDVSNNILSPSPSTKMDSIGFVTRDLKFNSGSFMNITGTTASGSDVIVKTGTNQAQICKPYDLYLMETPTSQVVGIVTEAPTSSSFKLGYGTSDPLGVNQSANGIGGNKSLLIGTNITGTLKKINLVTYSVNAEGTLIRKSYGNNTGNPLDKQIQTRELIYNVSNFQVRYLMDDGTISDNPTSNNDGRDNQQKMNRVIQMEVTITVLQSGSDLKAAGPVTIKEVISARNLRYTVN